MPQAEKWGYYQHLPSLDLSTEENNIGKVLSTVGIVNV